jgi:ATP-dependent 26S proteasome regulatory subunit
MKSEIVRLQHEQAAMKERIKDNKEKIMMNKQLPYLVGNVVEVSSIACGVVFIAVNPNQNPYFFSYLMWTPRKGMMKQRVVMLIYTVKSRESVQSLKPPQDR